MLNFFFERLLRFYERFEIYRKIRWWNMLTSRGMKIGNGVNFPRSTWIDIPHCFLISIGDNCGFGANCAILAHDAMPNEYIDATRIAKIIIHESCHFGMGTIILPGVEIGPYSVVGAGSVVNRDIPARSVAFGNPARVICTLDEFLDKHKERMKTAPVFPYTPYGESGLTSERMNEILEKLDRSSGYIVGGYTAMVKEGKCLVRTTGKSVRSQPNGKDK